MKRLSGTQVLLIEDEAIIASMVEDMLVELGATVVGPTSSINKGLVPCALDTCLSCSLRATEHPPSVRAGNFLPVIAQKTTSPAE